MIIEKKRRNSNIELYRIIVMVLIIAHHYVVNSGLMEVLKEQPLTTSSASMYIFGAWGKVGINCFVLITGYYMCKSKFTWQKFLKLYLQITFYAVIIYGIFCITGHESVNTFIAAFKLFPVKGIASNFTSCFLIFYLLVPFLNILLQNINKKQHTYLICLLLFIYSICPNFPSFSINFNYVEWFIVLYFISSYLRLYANEWNISHFQWGFLSILSLIVSSISVLLIVYFYQGGKISSHIPYYFIADSNKLLALFTAITSFMWFQGLKIKYYPWINVIGATTFGVFLIHTNGDSMRQWLWRDTVDCMGHFNITLFTTLSYAILSVITIFFICSCIDWLRLKFLEKPILRIINDYTSLISNKKFSIKKSSLE